MKIKYLRFFIVGMLVIFLVSALSISGIAKAPSDYKMVLILPGPINDQSWNAANYAGLLACNNTLGTKMEYVENVQASDFESTFRNYGERGYDLVISAGTQFDEAANRVGPSYPKTTYCVFNGMIANPPNICPVLPKEYEASFLAGLIAGYTTKTGKIGIAGGFPNKLMIRLLNTYEYGARIGSPRVEVIRAYANSWSDVTLGKQMAGSMIDKGADVLFFYANQVGLGAIQSCKEKGAKFIGFASDQNSIAPGTVVASAWFGTEDIYKWIATNYMSGNLKPVVNELGMSEGVISMSFTDEVSPELREIVKQAEDLIVEGKLLKFISQFPEPLE